METMNKSRPGLSAENSQNDRDEILNTAHMRKRRHEDEASNKALSSTGDITLERIRASLGAKSTGALSSIKDEDDVEMKPALKNTFTTASQMQNVHGVRDIGSVVRPPKIESEAVLGNDSGYAPTLNEAMRNTLPTTDAAKIKAYEEEMSTLRSKLRALSASMKRTNSKLICPSVRPRP